MCQWSQTHGCSIISNSCVCDVSITQRRYRVDTSSLQFDMKMVNYPTISVGYCTVCSLPKAHHRRYSVVQVFNANKISVVLALRVFQLQLVNAFPKRQYANISLTWGITYLVFFLKLFKHGAQQKTTKCCSMLFIFPNIHVSNGHFNPNHYIFLSLLCLNHRAKPDLTHNLFTA